MANAMAIQEQILGEIKKAGSSLGVDVSSYGMTCAYSATGAVLAFMATNNLTWSDVDYSVLKINIQRIALTELNVASYPPECYLVFNRGWGGKVGEIQILAQGAGNEALVRHWGVDVKQLKRPWLVREGDVFTTPYFDNGKMADPTWKPKFDSTKKVLYVVYQVIKKDDSSEWLVADRAGVASNLIAEIRQNARGATRGAKASINDDEMNAVFAKINDMTLEQLLADKELVKFINPTYTSGGSKESMIIRKMENNALRPFPKDYKNPIIKAAATGVIFDEDRDDSVVEDKDGKTLEKAMESATGNAVPDFSVPKTEGEKEEPKKEEPKKEEDYGFDTSKVDPELLKAGKK